MFGVAYGLSTVLLYRLLSLAGVPAFYDKLLQVPLLKPDCMREAGSLSGRPADSRLQGLATAFWYTPSLANRPRIDDQPTFTARRDVLL